MRLIDRVRFYLAELFAPRAYALVRVDGRRVRYVELDSHEYRRLQ